MGQYYSESLAGKRLERCYMIAPPRVVQYFESEIGFVSGHIEKENYVLELGSGYGRALTQLGSSTERLVGIDISMESLELAKQRAGNRLENIQANAINLPFQDNSFDVVICIQNGISAFKEDPHHLILESLRVTRPGGISLFSTYSEKFWEDRLDWFTIQAEEGLLGEIDFEKTGNGVIVCKDGFKAITFTENDFEEISSSLGLRTEISEVDESSLFCKFYVN